MSGYGLSSELEGNGSPSQDCFEDYQNRRQAYLARLQQPQDIGVDDSSDQSPYGVVVNQSQKNLITAYNQRKQEVEDEQIVIRNRIRQDRLQMLALKKTAAIETLEIATTANCDTL